MEVMNIDEPGTQKSHPIFGKRISGQDVLKQIFMQLVLFINIKLSIHEVYDYKTDSYLPFFKEGMFENVVLPILIVLITLSFVMIILMLKVGRFTYPIAILNSILLPAIFEMFLFIRSDIVSNVHDSPDWKWYLVGVGIFVIGAIMRLRDCKKPYIPK